MNGNSNGNASEQVVKATEEQRKMPSPTPPVNTNPNPTGVLFPTEESEAPSPDVVSKPQQESQETPSVVSTPKETTTALAPQQSKAMEPQVMNGPAGENVVITKELGRIVYPSFNLEYANVLTEGIDPKHINFSLFSEHQKELILKNMKDILVGEGQDEQSEFESGLEITERKRLRYLKLIKAEGQGTKGNFKIQKGADYITVENENTVDVFVLGYQIHRQYRLDKNDVSSTICQSFHTGSKYNQIPTVFTDIASGKGQVRSCFLNCPLAPNNPTFPKKQRCQSSFVFILVCREDPTQVLRMFEPMKNYDSKQQRSLNSLYAQCNNGLALAGRSYWLTLHGKEIAIPKSMNTTAVISATKGPIVSEQEAKILNMWREVIAVPYDLGGKSSQFLRVKNFVEIASLESTPSTSTDLAPGIQV